MKTDRWQLTFAAGFTAMSLALYTARWFLFPPGELGDLHNEMLRYLVDDVAFLLIQVPIVTLFIDRLLQRREKDAMLQKLNMVIGAFFTEVGNDLLSSLAAVDSSASSVREQLVPKASWKADDFAHARMTIAEHDAVIDAGALDLDSLRVVLLEHRAFVLNLLGNQSLLEHESFTDLLWAITHLAEELQARPDLSGLPRTDAAHISGDIKRAYRLLTSEWVDYMRHLQTSYPYLFSLAVRTNPFDPSARVTVEG